MAQNSFSGQLALISAAALWGLAYVFMKEPLMKYDLFLVTAFRFLTGFVFLYFILGKGKNIKVHEIMPGIMLGILVFFGFALNGFGLALSTPGRSGFLGSISVLLIPFFAYFMFGQKLLQKEKTAVVIAFAGLFLFAYTPDLEINIGEVALLMDNFPSALTVILTGIYLKKSDFYSLVTVQFLTVGILSLIISIPGGNYEVDAAFLPIMVISGIFLLVIPSLLGTWGQRFVSATNTGVIFALVPVFSLVFSNLIYGETFELQQLIGAGLILIGVLYSILKKEE